MSDIGERDLLTLEPDDEERQQAFIDIVTALIDARLAYYGLIEETESANTKRIISLS